MEWAALVTWILTAGGGFVMLASDSDVLAWIAFVLLLVVALLGFTMLAIWLRQRSAPVPADATAPAAAPASKPAEQRFPVPIVGAHGLLAVTTLVLVFLAAIGVGS